MPQPTRDRPSRFIVQILESGERLSSRDIYEKLEKIEPGRFTIQQVYRSVNTMNRSGRIKREGHSYYLESVLQPVQTPDALLEMEPANGGVVGMELTVAKIKRWFFDHPELEVHDSILLHKLELSEEKLVEGLKLLVADGTLTESTESDFLGTAYRLSTKAQEALSEVGGGASPALDTFELKARLDGIKHTLFSISKDLGKLESLVQKEIEGENP